MISVERYEELAGEILDTLPPAFFEQLNAGVVVSEERKLHPESREGSPLYILGEYTRSGLGHGVTLYYGSFAATCGDLPEEVDVGNGTGYPALAEDGDRAVKIRVCPTREEALFTHRCGIRRLFLLRHGDFINGIRKRLPITSMEAKLAMTTIGAAPKNNVRDTLDAAILLALGPTLPRTAADFDTACLRIRERVYDIVSGPLQKLWEQLSVTDASLRTYCVTASTDRYAAAIAEDLLADRHYLTRANFLSTHVALSTDGISVDA